MGERTVHIFPTRGVTTVRDLGGGPAIQGNVIGNALNGSAFSGKIPSDLTPTFSNPMSGLTFENSDG